MNLHCEKSGLGPDERALAAVAFADVVNFSGMMAIDERRTFEAVRSLLDDVVAPAVAAHGGVVVKWTGDGLLARFGDVHDAVTWAQAVQEASADVPGLDDDAPLRLRISINLGYVILAGDDVFGDEVNVAARLLGYAPPGGITLSEAAYEAVRGRLETRTLDLGLRTLKSFSRPVRVFAIVPGDAPLVPTEMRDRAVPSIAVLPLENLAGDAADDYFANGIVEDIIVSLAGLGELLVVSRASTLAFAGRPVDPRDVGRVLGVRYVLTGTLRRSQRSIRVGVQLCDAETGRALWSEVAETSPGELFDMQDWIVGRIVTGIAPNVRASELRGVMRKQPSSFTAYDHTLQALHLMNRLDRDGFEAAGERLQAALREDSRFAMPHAWLARWYMLRVGQGRSTSLEGDMAQAGTHAAQATELDGNNALALAIHGHVRSYLFHQYDFGLMLLERAIAASPSSSVARVLSAASLSYTGQGELAVQHAQQGLRLSPLDRNLFLTHNVLCLAHYANGDYSEAAKWGRLSLQQNPNYTSTHRLLIGSLVAEGQLLEARAVASEMLLVEPDFDVSRWERTIQPFRDRAVAKAYADRLRLALVS